MLSSFSSCHIHFKYEHDILKRPGNKSRILKTVAKVENNYYLSKMYQYKNYEPQHQNK